MDPIRMAGKDSDGKSYSDIGEMWKHELSTVDANGNKTWYSKAVDYWNKQPATVDGVLGGFEHVSDDDIAESAMFLLPFLLGKGPASEGPTARTRAVDCGAGVGRIADRLLVQKLGFRTVDLLEPCAHMLAKAREVLPADRVGVMTEGSVQSHDFGEGRYDLIVLQWVGIYLTDDDFVEFIKKARRSLLPNGIILIKENVSKSGFLVDKDDSSLTRTPDHYLHLIKAGGGTVLKEGVQQKFPEELFKVFMYAVR